MTRVADGQAARGSEKCGDDRGCVGAFARERAELLVEQLDEFGLIQPIDEPAHKRPQVGRSGRDRVAMPGDVRQQKAADPAGGAARGIVNIAPGARFSEGLAVDPGIQAAELDTARGELAAAPDLHALHVFARLIAHSGIIPERAAVLLGRVDLVQIRPAIWLATRRGELPGRGGRPCLSVACWKCCRADWRRAR